MTQQEDAGQTAGPGSREQSGAGLLLGRPARRLYDASFGKIRRDVAALRADIYRLFNGLDARQAAFHAELDQRFVELTQRVEELDKDVRTVVAGRMEIEAITRRLATIEDHLIEDDPAEDAGPAPRSDAPSS